MLAQPDCDAAPIEPWILGRLCGHGAPKGKGPLAATRLVVAPGSRRILSALGISEGPRPLAFTSRTLMEAL
jgi:hypothetical protein